MTVLNDTEFGEVTVRRSSLARYVRIKIGRDGKLSASLPNKAPIKFVKQLIDQSRDELRSVIEQHKKNHQQRETGSQVGKSHTLHIKHASTAVPKSRVANQQITIYLPLAMAPESSQAQAYISGVAKKALRKEAEAYLPRRVRYLAQLHGFDVNAVKFNNAKTRWGSCTSQGSINLNVALMQLPLELIDYVIIHELCHTRHMNHSQQFWNLVASYCPEYKECRKELHQHHPYI